MLLAEINGKSLDAARNSEDYLTSTVFGHLRYVPPPLFWDDLFKLAKGLPTDEQEYSLAERLAAQNRLPSGYTKLKCHFWKSHPTLGEPDLLLIFSGAATPALAVLIEAKLWSGKSGTGEQDQLIRYLDVLRDLPALDLHLPPGTTRYLIYLTPQDSLAEVEESAARLTDRSEDRDRLFRLQWQDVLLAAEGASACPDEPAKTILTDVSRFLHTLGLEYFSGFTHLAALLVIEGEVGSFYQSPAGGFRGFSREPGLDCFEIQKGAWT